MYSCILLYLSAKTAMPAEMAVGISPSSGNRVITLVRPLMFVSASSPLPNLICARSHRMSSSSPHSAADTTSPGLWNAMFMSTGSAAVIASLSSMNRLKKSLLRVEQTVSLPTIISRAWLNAMTFILPSPSANVLLGLLPLLPVSRGRHSACAQYSLPPMYSSRWGIVASSNRSRFWLALLTRKKLRCSQNSWSATVMTRLSGSPG